jgi:hypothetical protein
VLALESAAVTSPGPNASISKASTIGAILLLTTEMLMGRESSATCWYEYFRSRMSSPRRSQRTTCSAILLPAGVKPPSPDGSRAMRVMRSMSRFRSESGISK